MQRKQNKRSQSISRPRDNSFPSVNKADPLFKRVLRFQFAGTGGNVTRGQMLAACGVIVTAGSTTARYLADSCRIDRIVMWGVATSGSTAFSNVWVEFPSNNGPYNKISDVGTNAKPAHISVVPAKDSTASWWTSVAGTSQLSDVLFTVGGPAGTILDVHVTFSLEDGGATAYTIAASGGFNGIGYPPLEANNGSIAPLNRQST